MAYFQSGNIKIFYEEVGKGIPIVFMHGFSLNNTMWECQVSQYSKKYRVITYDARGHGNSESPESGYSREDRALDLLNLANHLSLPPFHLVGFSIGGGDALCFAIENQSRLNSLILVASVASGFKPKVKFHDYGDIVKEKGINVAKGMFIESSLSKYGDNHREIKEKLEGMMNTFSGKYWLDPMSGKYPKRDDVILSASVRIPVLIIVGENDISWMPLAKILNEKILDSRLEILSGVGHMVNLEAPDKFDQILNDFLSKIDIGAN
jgi:pimeloyl-ACP methyl ester carboxylesterase